MIVVRRYLPRIKLFPSFLILITSQGDGDSEIALVVEDDDMVSSTMDGRPYMASRFATTLRRKIFRGTLISI